jgi:23S rRNA (cytidine1920-2'-O)/16S rRNA (cytidine1409-2'-O)-methyltransferase
MSKQRLDATLVQLKLTSSRSQAESWIKLGKVTVDGRVLLKPGHFVSENSEIKLLAEVQYVSRAGLKLESVADIFKLNFHGKLVLDVGSSTGGFTDYALRHGAKKVYAVDVGTDQLHPSLRKNERVSLFEKTDIRNFVMVPSRHAKSVIDSELSSEELASRRIIRVVSNMPDIIVMDVSFISLREILPHLVNNLSNSNTQLVAMVKPQFEAGKNQTNKGVIKNDAMRRQILRDFEDWSKQFFVIQNKRDSDVAGAKGNQERFYLLKPLGK